MIGRTIAEERLPADYRAVVDRYWHPLAAEIARRAANRRPLVVGINGAQGSGKSTLCRFLEILLAQCGLHAVTVSLDDLYLTRAEREELAGQSHPRFATRGVPGTHDVALGKAALDRLVAGEPVEMPRFDKAHDDRFPYPIRVTEPVDVILFEGWCVGAAPQPGADLAAPVNALEAEEDREGVWRQEVNRRLATDYAELFAPIDLMVMLKVADFGAVRANRARQEAKLGPGPATMDEAALERFLMHYERLTRWMLSEMPDRADIVFEIGPDQRPASVRPALPSADGSV